MPKETNFNKIEPRRTRDIHVRTVIVVTSQIFLGYEQIMIFVKLPELAVNHIEMLVRKVVSHMIYVLLFF